MENYEHFTKLVSYLIKEAKNHHLKAKTDESIGDYHKGKRDGFELAAKWLDEALINTKYENLYD